MIDRIALAVIVGSTREGRFGDTIARWFVSRARQRDDVAIDVVDLAALRLPAVHAASPGTAVQELTRRIAGAEAFVAITPEYNHGYPASLKFALDSAYEEWYAKPIAFVSYGGISGGLRAVEQLRQVCAELHMVTVRDTVSFQFADTLFDGRGELRDPLGANVAAKKMLDQLVWWATALRAARAQRPYAA